MPIKRFDVVVLGGGPAGSAAALTLARLGRSVVIVEQSAYSHPRIGETLPPVVRRTLTSLGVWEQFVRDDHAPSFGIRSAWGQAALYENDFITNPYGAGWHVDRARFDAMLARAAQEAGASLLCGARLNTCRQQTSDAWELEIESGEAQHADQTKPQAKSQAKSQAKFQAKFLIDATGRASSLARQQGAHRISHDHLVGVAGWCSAGSFKLTPDSHTLVEASEHGWWYSAWLPGPRFIAIYLTDADLLPRRRQSLPAFWQAQLRQTLHTQARLRSGRLASAKLASALRVVAANSSQLDRVMGGGWLAAGDAALAFDPLSSQGLAHALTSGLRAGQTIDRCLAGEAAALDTYAAQTREVFREYARWHQVYYERERRWPESTFWRRRSAQPHTHG